MPPKFSANVKSQVVQLSKVSTARFLLACAMDWSVIALSIAAAKYSGNGFVYALSLFMIATRQHAFMILTHDATHFRANRKLWINDLISDIFCAYPVFFDTAIYRFRHLQHHEHLNSEQDPDWVRKVPFKEWAYPMTVGQFAISSLKYISYGGTLEWIQATRYFSGYSKISPKKKSRAALAGKAFYWAAALSVLAWGGWLLDFAVFWLLPFYFIFPPLQRLRSIAEHFGMSYSHDLQSSRDVRPNRIEAFLLSPHAVNFHLSHHLYPSVPFHNLPKLHKALMQEEVFREHAVLNTSYITPGRRSLWKDILKKEESRSQQTSQAA